VHLVLSFVHGQTASSWNVPPAAYESSRTEQPLAEQVLRPSALNEGDDDVRTNSGQVSNGIEVPGLITRTIPVAGKAGCHGGATFRENHILLTVQPGILPQDHRFIQG